LPNTSRSASTHASRASWYPDVLEKKGGTGKREVGGKMSELLSALRGEEGQGTKWRASARKNFPRISFEKTKGKMGKKRGGGRKSSGKKRGGRERETGSLGESGRGRDVAIYWQSGCFLGRRPDGGDRHLRVKSFQKFLVRAPRIRDDRLVLGKRRT